MGELTNKFANFLLSNRFARGDRTALLLPNCPQYYIALFGTHKAGGCVVSLNPILKEPELEFYFKEVKPKAVVLLDALLPLVKKSCWQLVLRVRSNTHKLCRVLV
ncbi:AMP-binding protein [Archaeoglobus sp.]